MKHLFVAGLLGLVLVGVVHGLEKTGMPDCRAKRIDALLAKMDAAQKTATQKDRDEAARAAKVESDCMASPAAAPSPKSTAEKAIIIRLGDTSLIGRYAEALQAAVERVWIQPKNLPKLPCVVHIAQLPGGKVISATADPSCPYDDEGKRSVERAVVVAAPLPYSGFESVFSSRINFTFHAFVANTP